MSPQVYQTITHFCVFSLPGLILKSSNLTEETISALKKGKRIEFSPGKKAERAMVSYIANYVKLLGHEASPETNKIYLSNIVDISLFAIPFRTYQRKLIRNLS